jgi:two-component system nitrogen regulation response regulator NtrX
LRESADDGLQILERVKGDHPYIPFLMISGHGTIETAVQAIQQGAYDFIEKPFKSDRLLLMIRRALDHAELQKENAFLKRSVQGYSNFIGDSSVTEQLRAVLMRVAATNSRVLITGEAGVGKDVAARFIHMNSDRKNESFKVLNCANLDPDRLEEELFGVEGQVQGALEAAHGGTLFLDQVVDMPYETQGKILRVLQEQRFNRVGGAAEIEVDVRIIASSNKNLQAEIDAGKFREDLYYRLNVVPLDIPPLRKRPDDVPVLIAHFMAQFCMSSGFAACQLSDEALFVLTGYIWPGNVRQLRNVVEWVLIMHGAVEGGVIEVEHLPPEVSGQAVASKDAQGLDVAYTALPLRAAREGFERDYMASQIDRFDGNVSKMAKFVGMERSALHRKLKSLGISVNEKDNAEDKRKSA